MAKVHNVRLTEQQTKEFQEAFSLFDRKGTNCVELGDVGPLIRSVGLSPSESDVKGMQHDIERSGKRALEYQDFLDLVMRNQNLKETSENIREAFRTFDKDGNGFVSAAELRHVLTSLGERLSDEEVDELIREADITGDGQVNYDDFVRILQE